MKNSAVDLSRRHQRVPTSMIEVRSPGIRVSEHWDFLRHGSGVRWTCCVGRVRLARWPMNHRQCLLVTQFANARWHTQYNVLMRSRHDLSRCKGIDASGSPIQNGDQFQFEHSNISDRYAGAELSLDAVRNDSMRTSGCWTIAHSRPHYVHCLALLGLP